MESPSLPVETIEKYLVDAINGPGFDKMEFIRGRVRVALHNSNRYILCDPLPVRVSDDTRIFFVIDIYIQADKPTTAFGLFEQDIKAYMQEEFSTYSSSDSDIAVMKDKLLEEVRKKCRQYYYFVKILDVKIGVLR